MHAIDYGIVIFFLLGLLGLGYLLSSRAGKNTDEFILAGRKVPWWLAGISVSANNLSAGSMMNDSRKIRQDGVGGLWFTWGMVVGGMISSIFFLRLWRRARFTTQMEFYQARYVGTPATLARLFDAVVYGGLVAAIWAGSVLVGMRKLVLVLLDLPAEFMLLGWSVPTDLAVVIVLVVVTLVYSAASGVYGILWTDLIEYIIAVAASLFLMVLVYQAVGWNTGLRDQLMELGEEGTQLLSLVPEAAIPIMFYFLVIQPLMAMGAYSPAAQRHLGLRNERDVIYTSFLSGFLNQILKPWPVYICGLAGLLLVSDQMLIEQYPMIIGPDGMEIPDYEKVYPYLIRQYLPLGMAGLMISAFLGAFMSSFDTNIHNSTSILVNDIYRPYLAKGRDAHHYVRASRVCMCMVTVGASLIGFFAQDMLKLIMFGIAISLAPGLIKLLRFIWWRVNGIAEVVTQGISLVTVLVMIGPTGTWLVNRILAYFDLSGNDIFFVTRQLILLSTSTVISLLVIGLTKPEPTPHLCAFYKRVRPFGFWGPVREACGPDAGKPDSVLVMSILSLSAIVALFSSIFFVMGIALALWKLCVGSILLIPPAVAGVVWGMRKLYPEKVVDG